MTVGSMLKPSKLKYDCDSCISKMQKDSINIGILEKKIDNMCNDTQLKGQAYNAMRRHLSDYHLILESLVSANSCDIKDCESLKEQVGDEVLDGEKILQEIKIAKSQLEYNSQQVIKYNNLQKDEICNSTCGLPITWTSAVKVCYAQIANNYEKAVETSEELIKYWIEKKELYNVIQNKTSQLFQLGIEKRKYALQGLKELKNYGNKQSYSQNTNAIWKINLMKSLADPFYKDKNSTNADSSNIDMNYVETFLKRGAGYIGQNEMNLFADVFCTMDNNQKEEVLRWLCSSDKKVVVKEVGTCTSSQYNQWTPDRYKCQMLLHGIKEIMQVENENSEYNFHKVGVVGQNYGLLSEFLGVRKYLGYCESNKPIIHLSNQLNQKSENTGVLSLEFKEDIDMVWDTTEWVENPFYNSNVNIHKCCYTVELQGKMAENKLERYTYQFVTNTGNEVISGVESMGLVVTSYGLDMFLPGSGTAFSAATVFDSGRKGIQVGKGNEEIINSDYSMEIEKIVRDTFGYGGVLSTYKSAEEATALGVNISFFEGPQTKQRVKEFNELLVYAKQNGAETLIEIETPVTMSMIEENPVLIYTELKKLSDLKSSFKNPNNPEVISESKNKQKQLENIVNATEKFWNPSIIQWESRK